MSDTLQKPRQREAPPPRVEEQLPLVVDLDGTLTKSDLLYESFFQLLVKRPHLALLAPLWLLGGKAKLKREIASRVSLDPALLPYRDDVRAYVEEQREQGRRVILATASDELLARPVASHIGLFDDVLASDGETNLSGQKKLARVQALLGGAPFEYLGNSDDDVPLWQAAEVSVAVDASERQVAGWGKQRITFARVFARTGSRARALIKALRPHQWAKNLLLPVPLFLSHRFFEGGPLLSVALAFVAFSLCASSVYVLNDLVDLPNDRLHTRKKSRPFAAGTLPLPIGMALVPLLLLAAALTAVLGVSLEFALALLAYYVVTLAYSLGLKRVALLDVIVLAGLYTLRLVGGAVAAGAHMSWWLSAFSLFLFVDLALVKRYTELAALVDKAKEKAAGRGYHVKDLPHLASLGAAAGYVAVLVLALYVQSDDVRQLYSRPALLWGLLPLMLYWTSRLWLLVARGEMHDDPIVFAIKDVPSYLIAVGTAVIVLFAI